LINLASLLEQTSRLHPQRTAIVNGDKRLTYAQVNAAANQVANLLVSWGIEPGDRVAISCPNLPWFSIVYYGILKAGAVVVPLNVMLKGQEIAYHLEDSSAKAYLCFEGSKDLPIGSEGQAGFSAVPGCQHLLLITGDTTSRSRTERPETLHDALAAHSQDFSAVPVEDDDAAVILYTSGTTGRPKGAELTHSNMVSNALVCQELFASSPDRPDTFLCALPLFHSFGQTVIQNAAFALGGTVVMLPRFDADAALRLMGQERVTFFAGVPTMYWGLLRAAEQSDVNVGELAGHLRVAVAGGSALPVEVHKEFAERFGITILEGYGLSETSPVASFTKLGEDVRVGSIGLPIPEVQMKLIHEDWTECAEGEVGEIAIKGPNIMKGYLGRPQATAEAIRDGWLRSGDLARRDADGFYYIVDRSKDLIIRGGYNVYPREVEETLLEHPEVSLAAVVGIPHHSHGEEVKAVVIRTHGSELTEEELVRWAKGQMAAYKYPRYVEFRDALPMTATGKILKRALT
jgi:long-chain acyl-CoA synthetase